MSDIIGVVTDIKDDEYQGKDFKVVTLGTGQQLKVKHGRDEALKKKWGLLQVGVAIKFTMQDYTKPDGVKIPFVADIETVANALPQSGGSAEILPEHQAVIEEAKQAVAQPARDSGKNKAFAISYAKDLAVAKIITPEKILTYAEVFNRYMNGDITLKDQAAFDTMIGKHFIEEAH